MGRVTRIEVHFVDDVAGPRRVVLLPSARVDTIFLRSSENKVEFKKKVRRGFVDPTHLGPGITVEGTVLPQKGLGSKRGPGDVCYLQGGVLKCWKE